MSRRHERTDAEWALIEPLMPPPVRGRGRAAGRAKRSYLGARYRRLVPRLGKKKAIVAVEHSILTAAWHMLTDDVDYHDLGGDYFARLDPERAMRRIVRQANALGYTVRFDPIQAA